MKFNRRFICSAVALPALAVTGAWVPMAWAQDYPNKPLRIVVPFPPGGSNDVLGRVLGQKISEAMGQPVLVDNKAGAAGNIGTDFVAKAPADGYTLLVASNTGLAINPVLYPKLPFDAIKDFEPITLLGGLPIVLVINANVKASSVTELIALAKKDPNKITYASAGAGTPQHMSAELFKSMTGTKITQVPYKGSGPALIDVIAGTVDIMFCPINSALPHIRSGKLRALGVATAKRVALLPEVATVAETVPGYISDIWVGIVAPAKTPAPVIAKLNTELRKALSLPDVKDKLAEQGIEATSSTPAEFANLIAADQKRWAVVIKGAAIQPD